MSRVTSGQALNAEMHYLVSSAELSKKAKGTSTKLAAWTSDRNIPFLITSIGMIVMLLWAGSYKMTAPGTEGIVPLVSNSLLISWHFKLFGPYIGSDLIGLTEIITAVLMIGGYLKTEAGAPRAPGVMIDFLLALFTEVGWHAGPGRPLLPSTEASLLSQETRMHVHACIERSLPRIAPS